MENVSVENKESKVIESTGRTIFVRDMAYNTLVSPFHLVQIH